MVLTKPELIASFQSEVRILLHLAGKLAPADLDYRPTPKQRSALELLKYPDGHGTRVAESLQRGGLRRRRLDESGKGSGGAHLRADDRGPCGAARPLRGAARRCVRRRLRADVEMFGMRMTRGAFIVNQVLRACAAYRTKLFLYLKACGHDELNTMNLWAGMDAPAPA